MERDHGAAVVAEAAPERDHLVGPGAARRRGPGHGGSPYPQRGRMAVSSSRPTSEPATSTWSTIVDLLAGGAHCPCAPGCAVTQLDHALQTAALLERKCPDDAELAVAGLVHDIGHLLPGVGDEAHAARRGGRRAGGAGGAGGRARGRPARGGQAVPGGDRARLRAWLAGQRRLAGRAGRAPCRRGGGRLRRRCRWPPLRSRCAGPTTAARPRASWCVLRAVWMARGRGGPGASGPRLLGTVLRGLSERGGPPEG